MRSQGTCIKHIVRMDGGGLLMTTETLMWSDCRSADDECPLNSVTSTDQRENQTSVINC